MRSTILLPVLLCAVACGAQQVTRSAVAPSNAAIAIEVVQDTVLAGRFQRDLAAQLRQTVLESQAGVPVADPSKADLVLRVTVLSVNFSNATSWEWQLVDVDTGAIVAAQTDSSAMGRNAGPLASDIVGALGRLDLAPYVGGSTAVAAAKPVEESGSFPPSATDGSNAWAIVIGVEDYRDGLPKATGAANDARAFASFAEKTLNVPKSNIKLLVGDRAGRADVTGALSEWLPKNAVTPGGRVYVYFSGHGAPNVEDGSPFLLPYDANPTYIKSSGLAVTEVQGQLAALQDQQVFVFLDACFSGIGERSALPEGTRPVVPVKEVAAVGGVVTFAAAGATETTGAAENGQQGLFSYHLLQGLRGPADGDGDGDIEVGELQRYLSKHVASDARRQNREQTPTLAASGESMPLVKALGQP